MASKLDPRHSKFWKTWDCNSEEEAIELMQMFYKEVGHYAKKYDTIGMADNFTTCSSLTMYIPKQGQMRILRDKGKVNFFAPEKIYKEIEERMQGKNDSDRWEEEQILELKLERIEVNGEYKWEFRK